MEKVPAIIKEGTEEDLLRIALIENIQRSDLSVIEEARAYECLIKEYGLTQDACARKLVKTDQQFLIFYEFFCCQ